MEDDQEMQKKIDKLAAGCPRCNKTNFKFGSIAKHMRNCTPKCSYCQIDVENLEIHEENYCHQTPTTCSAAQRGLCNWKGLRKDLQLHEAQCQGASVIADLQISREFAKVSNNGRARAISELPVLESALSRVDQDRKRAHISRENISKTAQCFKRSAEEFKKIADNYEKRCENLYQKLDDVASMDVEEFKKWSERYKLKRKSEKLELPGSGKTRYFRN